MQTTVVTDIEQVRDEDENLLYIEYLVAVFDLDIRDPADAKVLGTEKVRVARETPTTLRATHHDPVTEEQIETFMSADVVDTVIEQAKTKVTTRVSNLEKTRKWQAEPLSR